MERAVDECIHEGILTDFLSRNRAEVIKMSIFEYDQELEEKKLREAEFEAGREEGERIGFKLAAIEFAQRLLATREFSLEKISTLSGLPLAEIKKLQSS